jgi:hypothetical protein
MVVRRLVDPPVAGSEKGEGVITKNGKENASTSDLTYGKEVTLRVQGKR